MSDKFLSECCIRKKRWSIRRPQQLHTSFDPIFIWNLAWSCTWSGSVMSKYDHKILISLVIIYLYFVDGTTVSQDCAAILSCVTKIMRSLIDYTRLNTKNACKMVWICTLSKTTYEIPEFVLDNSVQHKRCREIYELSLKTLSI